MDVNLQQIGSWLGAILLGAGAYFGNRAIDNAKKRAKKAEYGAEESTFEAESKLYRHLRDRLEALETDTMNLRNELDFERRRSRYMETHIWKLEDLMRKQGLDIPVFHPPSYIMPIKAQTNADQRET